MVKLTGSRVLVLGHTGLVGGALVRRLIQRGAQVSGCSSAICDLRRQYEVETTLKCYRPNVVFLAAATVGGIEANRLRPAEFAYDNLAIALHVIEASRQAGVEKLVFLGSSCIYPRDAEQPIKETALLRGPLEETNRAYAVAKIAGIELCRSYRTSYSFDAISVMPPNVYGEDDHFDGRDNHVMAALISRIVRAKAEGRSSITIWGTGKPVREFLHADDLADALCILAERYSSAEPINVGWGSGVSILELAHLIADAANWKGTILTNPDMPDGHPIKVMDVSRVWDLVGWRPRIGLREGIARVVSAYEDRRPVPLVPIATSPNTVHTEWLNGSAL